MTDEGKTTLKDGDAQNFRMETPLSMGTPPPAESTSLQAGGTRTADHEDQKDIDWLLTFNPGVGPAKEQRPFRYDSLPPEKAALLAKLFVDYLKAMPPEQVNELVGRLDPKTRARLSIGLTNRSLRDLYGGMMPYPFGPKMSAPFDRISEGRVFDPEDAGKALDAITKTKPEQKGLLTEAGEKRFLNPPPADSDKSAAIVVNGAASADDSNVRSSAKLSQEPLEKVDFGSRSVSINDSQGHDNFDSNGRGNS